MKTILAKMKFDPELDYDDIGEVFSRASGNRVWCERSGNTVGVYTDGNKDEVIQRIMDKASAIIEDIILEAIAFDLSGMGQWERKARLN